MPKAEVRYKAKITECKAEAQSRVIKKERKMGATLNLNARLESARGGEVLDLVNTG